MNKKLVYTNKNGVEMEKNYALQLEMNLNKALDVFHSLQSFAKIEDAKQAFMFAADPTKYFDDCMIKATEVKPIGSVPLHAESVANLWGINRQGFISSCIGRMPGGSKEYYPIRLTPRDENIVKFENGKFIINEIVLNERIEKQKVYAETSKEIELLEYWENLAEMLNNHVRKGFVNQFEIFKTARALGLKSEKDKFEVDYFELAQAIKKIA